MAKRRADLASYAAKRKEKYKYTVSNLAGHINHKNIQIDKTKQNI